MRTLTMIAVAAAAALSVMLGGPASATVFCTGPSGCLLNPGRQDFDFTVPDDGLTHVWQFRLESDDPNATLFVAEPNQVFIDATYHEQDGSFVQGFSYDVKFKFSRTAQPGLVTYIVSAPRSYNNCGKVDVPLGLCAAQFNVWNNAAGGFVASDATVRVFFTDLPAIPEPSVWALLIGGLGLTGVSIRSRLFGARPASLRRSVT